MSATKKRRDIIHVPVKKKNHRAQGNGGDRKGGKNQHEEGKRKTLEGRILGNHIKIYIGSG